MSQFLLVFTVIIVSPQKILLISERVDLVEKRQLARREISFENNEAGFKQLTYETDALKESEKLPATDCVFNLNREARGYLTARAVPPSSLKNITAPEKFSVAELAVLCRKAKAGF